MKTNTHGHRNENHNEKNTFKGTWKRIVLLSGLCLLSSLAANFFINQKIDLLSSLKITAMFGLFLAIGLFSQKK